MNANALFSTSPGLKDRIRAALGLTRTEKIWEIEFAVSVCAALNRVGSAGCAIEYMPDDPLVFRVRQSLPHG